VQATEYAAAQNAAYQNIAPDWRLRLFLCGQECLLAYQEPVSGHRGIAGGIRVLLGSCVHSMDCENAFYQIFDNGSINHFVWRLSAID
jgi:hypothetical protein